MMYRIFLFTICSLLGYSSCYSQIDSVIFEPLNGDDLYNASGHFDEYIKTDPCNGPDTTYYSNGLIKTTVQNNDDESKRLTEYYANENIWTVWLFKNCNLDGRQISYWPNGKLQKEGFFLKGESNGNMKEWYETGDLKMESESIDPNKIEVRFYHENGSLKSHYYKNINQDYIGEAESYCENGKLLTRTNFDLEVYEKTYFHCNGKIWKKGMIKYNLFWIGDYIEYHENGAVMMAGEYKELLKFNESVKNGQWKYFDEQGELLRSESWILGKLEDHGSK